MATPYSPTGIIWQTEAIIEWVFLHHKQTKLLTTYVDVVNKLILNRRTRIQQLLGYDPKTIILPFSKIQIEHLYIQNIEWQIALSDFIGDIDCHYPSKLINFLKIHALILSKIKKKIQPIHNAVTYFIDANKDLKTGSFGPTEDLAI